MTESEARVAYMTTHVRACGHDVNRWTDREILEVYAILAPPAVKFAAWLQATGYVIEGANSAPATAPTHDGLSEAEQIKANEAAVMALTVAKLDDPQLNFVTVKP